MLVFYQIMKPKQGILTLYKNRGETPLECINRFKIHDSRYMNDKMTYAGRLDPLAEGLLLILVGEECKNREKYLGLDKEYEVDILFGFSTDTYDVLGMTKTQKDAEHTQINAEEIQNILQSFIGKFSQKYPAYSSKNIKEILKIRNRKNAGLALKSEAGKGESSVFFEVEEEIPEKEVEIKDIELLGEKIIQKEDLEKYIIESINLVKGDFRQEQILKEWDNTLSKTTQNEFNIISLKVDCTSGTYMRSLANAIGEKAGIPALALNIKRTRVGDFTV